MNDTGQPDGGRAPSQAELEAAVRQYVGKMALRYVPLAIGLVVLLIIVVTVPTVSEKNASVAADRNVATEGDSSNNNAGDTATTVPGLDANPLTGSTAGATGGSLVPRARSLPPSITPPAAFGAKGKTRSGLECDVNVKQVTWTVYAPPCIPAYIGNNGGATSHGVTSSTISAVFRRTNSAEEKAAFAAVGDAAPGTDDEYLADLRTYLGYFNATYELYGRHLEVHDFNGQGDNLEEDQGRMLEGAQADAKTAHDEPYNGFMDLSSSPTLASTQPYEENLAAQKVIAIGAVGLPHSWFKQYAPYEYSIAPDGTKAVTGAVHMLCQRLAGQNAVYSGSAVFQNAKRKFGLIAPENDQYQVLAKQLADGVKAECNESFVTASYAINIATMAEQSTTIIASMQSAQVSHLACICDPVVEIFFSQNADGQKYYPEWSPTAWLDPQGRENAPNEWSHAMAGQWIDWPAKAKSEAYRVFKLASPNTEPKEQYYAEAYWTLLYVYSALQLAGPNLNPTTFQQGVFAMPRTPTGMFGTWQGGKDAFSPTVDVQVSYWSATTPSNMDEKPGSWVPCEGHKWFDLNDPNGWGQKGTQLHCFGK